jgi:hypothetical protein
MIGCLFTRGIAMVGGWMLSVCQVPIVAGLLCMAAVPHTPIDIDRPVKLSLTCHFPVIVGQSVPMTVTLDNTSTRKVHVLDVGECPDCVIKVIDTTSGKRVPCTPYGESLIGDEYGRTYLQSYFRTLNPSENFKWDIDLAGYFNLEPGSYEIILTTSVSDESHEKNHGVEVKARLQVHSN